MTLSISTTGALPVKATPINNNDEIVEIKEEQKSIYNKFHESNNKSVEENGSESASSGSITYDSVAKFIDSNKNLIGMGSINFLKKYYQNHNFEPYKLSEIYHNLKAELKLLNYVKDNNIDLKMYYVEDIFRVDKSSCEGIMKSISNTIKKCGDNTDCLQTKIAEAGTKYIIENAKKKYKLSDSLFADKEFKIEYLNNAIDAVEAEIKAGKTKPEDKSKKIREYIIAQNYQWSIKGYNDRNTDPSITLGKKLISFYRNNSKTKLNKADILMASKNSLVSLTKGMFEKMFNDLAKHKDEEFKNNPALFKEYGSVENYIDKSFKQTVGKLLVNTLNAGKDREYNVILAAVEAFKPEDRLKAIHAVIGTATDDQGKAIDQSSKNFFNKSVQELGSITKGMSSEDTKATTLALATPADRDVVINEVKNQDELAVAKFKDNGQIPQQNIDISGALTAVVVGRDDYTPEDEIKLAEHHVKLQQEQPEIFKAKAKSIANLLENNNGTFLPDQKKKVVARLDIITNGNYSKLLSNPDSELNPPADIEALKMENDNIGIKTKEGVDISANVEKSSLIKKQIEEQTKAVENPEEEKFFVENASQVDVAKSNPSNSLPEGTLLTSSSVLRNVTAISVADIKTFSIGLSPLLKQFSELSASVQNHIKTRLESRSEDEQVQSIDQMDKNSDKVDIALQLKISEDKLKELHLDTNARKCLELHEDVA